MRKLTQIAIIFICWKRTHYDKSTLSFLSDCAYQCKHLPEYWSKKASILKLITKKVTVWHYALRRNTVKFNDTKSIEDTAKSIASSGFLNFHTVLCSTISPRLCWTKLMAHCRENWILLFRSVSRNCQKSHQVTLLWQKYIINIIITISWSRLFPDKEIHLVSLTVF